MKARAVAGAVSEGPDTCPRSRLLAAQALLLEEGGQLTAARDVLVSARAAVTRARVELAAANRRSADEHLRWVTGSRSQPTDEAAALVAGEAVIPGSLGLASAGCAGSARTQPAGLWRW